MISHGNLIYSVGQALVLAQVISEVYVVSEAHSCYDPTTQPSDCSKPPQPKNPEGIPVTLAFLPLHHTYGLHAYSFRAALAPGTLVLLSKWNIHAALKAIPKSVIRSWISQTDG